MDDSNPTPSIETLINPERMMTIDALQAGEAKACLAAAGMSVNGAEAKGQLFAQLARQMSAANVAGDVHALFVPGRIELFGKHTDYCGGRSLLCTVDRGFCIIAAPRTDGIISILDGAAGETIDFDPAKDLPGEPGHWSGYARAVVGRLARNFGDHLKRGATIGFLSDLPQAAGLSSCSALITGLFIAIARTNHLAQTAAWRENFHSLEDLAAYAGCIENGSSFGTLAGDRGVGTFGGSQDHTAILCCRPGCISQFSFGPVHREADIAFPAGGRLAVLLSGVVANKTGSAMADYNAVSLRARRLVELGNAAGGTSHRYLNELVTTPAAIEQLLHQLAELPSLERQSLTLRLEQFLRESTQLIPAAADALRAGDWAKLGEITSQSHALAITHLKNQVPATIDLQQQAMQHGALAASAFGAGFGGSVWAIYPQAMNEETWPAGSFFTSPSIPLTVLGK